MAFIAGWAFAMRKSAYAPIAIVLLGLSIPFIVKYANKMIDKLERDRLSFRKGATGEATIGYILERLPDHYQVIHDVKTPSGNIDHVVVGPTGAFVIDTKNWKGVVTGDGNGGLLLNGKSTPKSEIKNLTRTIMDLKDKIKVLNGMDPYIQGVLAFPSAHVDAKWGQTGHVHCVREEHLRDYISDSKRGRQLTSEEVDAISRAIGALASMDKEFKSASQS